MNEMPQGQQGTTSLSRVRERVRVRARELRKASPDAEQKLWQRLRNRQLDGWKFRRQHPIDRYFADFACIEAGLIVELDGGQHFEPDAIRADARRTSSLNAAGFHVLRFNDRDVLLQSDAVLSSIHDWIQTHHPHPNPLPPAGEGVKTLSKERS
jgi:very-short-patch-repair endonuclease